VVEPPIAAVHDWPLTTLGELTLLRMQLRDQSMPHAPPAAHDDDVDRLLLAFEELTSNGLRHGKAPVHVTVTTTADGWLIDVTDAATDQPPTPAIDRDPANGGLGLHLVARLCASHGWSVDTNRKHVWAYIRRTSGKTTVAAAT
jgi:two-component sensor histidine kinase